MSDDHGQSHGHHHILPYKTGFIVFVWLVVFTIITVAVARVDLGALNFPVAMAIATCKALMVCLIFMGLKYDTNDNRTIFFTGFIFLSIFVILTGSDLMFRPNEKASPKDLEAMAAGGKAKFKKPWNPQPEVLAHGKVLFEQQCVSCHGASGHGDGIAAAALNPKPRNFTAGDGWKNGRKPSQIFKTLKTGLNAMPSFSSMPAEDRWALAHHVAALGPDVLKDSEADLRAVDVDPNAETAGGTTETGIPVEAAMELMIER